jgi:hypothetical protein
MKDEETGLVARSNGKTNQMDARMPFGSDIGCGRAQSMMSAFIDSMTGPEDTKLFDAHVDRCPPCQRQLQGYVSARNVLRSADETPPPSDLAFRIRLRLARARDTGSRITVSERVRLWTSHAARAFAFPAAVGISMTLVCFAIVLESMAAYSEVQIKEPTLARIGRATPAAIEHMMVEVFVSPQGRSAQYTVLSGPQGDPEVDRWIHELMSFAEFKPATLAGRPISGRLIMSIPGTSIGVLADGLPGASLRVGSSAI